MTRHFEAVVIGASSGGLEAFSTILPQLPADFPLPIAIVQHRSPESGESMAQCLDAKTPLRVKEAIDKERLQPGTAYVAPADYHLLIEEDRTFSLSVDERVLYCRPAVDVLFESAAEVYEDRLIAILLTGSNSDGAAGLKSVMQHGGLTIVQDPDTAHADTMPREALRETQADHVVALEEIGPLLMRHCTHVTPVDFA